MKNIINEIINVECVASLISSSELSEMNKFRYEILNETGDNNFSSKSKFVRLLIRYALSHKDVIKIYSKELNDANKS